MPNFVLISLGRSSVIAVPPTPTPRSGLPVGKHATTAAPGLRQPRHPQDPRHPRLARPPSPIVELIASGQGGARLISTYVAARVDLDE